MVLLASTVNSLNPNAALMAAAAQITADNHVLSQNDFAPFLASNAAHRTNIEQFELLYGRILHTLQVLPVAQKSVKLDQLLLLMENSPPLRAALQFPQFIKDTQAR